MPEVTLSLPAAVVLLAVFLFIGAAMVFFALPKVTPEVVAQSEPTSTATITPTETLTPTEAPATATGTPEPTPTPQTYTVASGDSCITIAAYYHVSVEAIRQENSLSIDCSIFPGNVLRIPQPTPTVTPLPSSTLSPLQSTEQACQKVIHEVQQDDTPNKIAQLYNVPWDAIKSENGIPRDVVYFGEKLTIPLCQRPTPMGPTPTATQPPPYLAPNLLLPADGTYFSLTDDTITLQWASVGTLRDNEGYLVVVEHVTGGQGDKIERFVSDTKFVIPASFRPTDRNPHIYYWWVSTVRQTSTDSEGNPVYQSAGAASPKRSFSWSSTGAAPTAAP
jgi:LysM repeat protein